MNVQGVDSEKLLEALTRVLRDKGLVDDDDIAERIAATDRGSPEQGARMVARAVARFMKLKQAISRISAPMMPRP